MELRQLGEKVYYIQNPANVGVIRDRKTAILIDSGLDDDTARKILKILERENLYPKAIINTHSHTDHCGGNAHLKEKTGSKIYAPEIESAIIENPLLEPLYLFSGANPIINLKNKFLMARSSKVDYVIRDGKKLGFDEIELDIVNLPGHSPNQIGIVIDNILFCADSVFSKDMLRRHRPPFYIDIDAQKKTLNFLKDSRYKLYVPGHADPLENITELVDMTLEIINDVEEYLIRTTREKKTTEQILKDLCSNYRIKIKDVQHYYLMKTVVMAYLSSLNNRKILDLTIEDNMLHWRRI